MRKNFFKKISAVALSLTMVVGMVGTVPAAVKTGTDISNGVKWQAFSIHTREDGGKWEDELKKAGQVYNNQKNAFKSYCENAKPVAYTHRMSISLLSLAGKTASPISSIKPMFSFFIWCRFS